MGVDKESNKAVGSSPLISEPLTKKRKRTATSTPSKLVDLTNDDDAREVASPSKKKKKAATPKKATDEEKRLRRFRQHAPSTYLEKLHRATTQRYRWPAVTARGLR